MNPSPSTREDVAAIPSPSMGEGAPSIPFGADADPAFRPWQPNASANGRTLMMLLDSFGERGAAP